VPIATEHTVEESAMIALLNRKICILRNSTRVMKLLMLGENNHAGGTLKAVILSLNAVSTIQRKGRTQMRLSTARTM
jgi:hypothetical protein